MCSSDLSLMLRQLGCHAYQGYLFGTPMPLDAFEAWFASAQRRAECDGPSQELRA